MNDSEAPPEARLSETPVERRRWRICFWLVFLLTPLLVIVTGLLPGWEYDFLPAPIQQFLKTIAPGQTRAFGCLIVGALVAGLCLAKLYAKPKTGLGILTATVLFAFGVLIAYLSICFFGCLLVMSSLKF